MARSRAELAGWAALAAAAAIALPAIGQGNPESLLPPGFGEPPVAAPAPPPAQPVAPPAAGTPVPVVGPDGAPPLPIVAVAPDAEPTPEELAAAEEAGQADELPPEARRGIENIGALAVARGGFAPDAFGRADGRFLGGLMRRLDAPFASRWASMLLRRALLSGTDTPANMEAADWVAERAALLLRMGEADAARMLVQAVDTDRYSKRLYRVALTTAEANSDPVALCAVADRGAAAAPAPEWPLARAICAGLRGDSATSGAVLDKARTDRTARGVDLLLAEKLAAAGTNDRRAIGITWRSVERLTPWRFGMGNAAFVAMPPALLERSGPAMLAWAARTPTIPLGRRVAPARTAAVLGVFSTATLTDLYATLGDDADPTAEDATPTGRLRTAFTAADTGDRVAALRALWADPVSADEGYAGLILAARAATRIAPATDHAADAGDVVASLLSAGFDRRAAAWGPMLPTGSTGERGWSLLLVGAPTPVLQPDGDRIEAMGRTRRAQLLLAGLGGLGRLTGDELNRLSAATGAGLGHRDGWTRAIDRAAALRQPATVALLAGVGMQAGSWDGVPAAYLMHIVRALAATGHEAEARMIAAEAIMRSA